MVNSRKINDNITISYIPMKKLKTTSAGVYLHRPLSRDEVSVNALLSYVLKRGCRKYPTTSDISIRCEELYGASFSSGVMKMGETQIISLSGDTISDRYAPEGEHLTSEIISLILSVLFDPLEENGAFKESYVEQEKQTLRDNINAVINDKGVYAQVRCTEIMCENEAYGIRVLGRIDDIDKITARGLYEHYRKIISSSKIDIFVAGDADIDALCEDIKDYIKDFEFKPCEYPETKAAVKGGEIRNVTDHLDVTQGKLALGLRTGITPKDDNYWGLVVANSVFGSGAHSKLFNNVREKMSLAYYAASQLDKSKGVMFVNSGIEFENYEKAYAEIMRQLENVKQGIIGESEINAAKNAIINAFNSYYDNEGYMIIYYLTERLLGTDNDIEYAKERIEKVTTEDIMEAAKEIELDTVYFLAGKEE